MGTVVAEFHTRKGVALKTPRTRREGQPDKTQLDVGMPGGFWASVIGSPTAVIAVIAVLGLIAVSIFVVRLAQHAIERSPVVAPVTDVQR